MAFQYYTDLLLHKSYEYMDCLEFTGLLMPENISKPIIALNLQDSNFIFSEVSQKKVVAFYARCSSIF